MDEAHKELVKRLREERKLTWKDCNAAADALDALAGEVALVKSAHARLYRDHEEMVSIITAERDRLKAALEGIACNADEATDLPLFRVQCRDFARKALGDAS